MAKFKVAISGWAVVEVEAATAEEAENKVADEAPDMAGELYNLEVHEAVPADEAFKMHTDLE
jgi:hypothetical protein